MQLPIVLVLLLVIVIEKGVAEDRLRGEDGSRAG